MLVTWYAQLRYKIQLNLGRFINLYITSLILIIGLLARLINLQVFNASILKNKATSIQVRKTNVLASEGEVNLLLSTIVQ